MRSGPAVEFRIHRNGLAPIPTQRKPCTVTPGVTSSQDGQLHAAPGPPRSATNQHLSGLQRTVGNQAVLRLLSRPAPAIQPKLTVNQPGDRYEQEADRVAEQVMRMPDPDSDERPSVTPAAPHVQRACACGGASTECESYKKKNEERILQRSAAGVASPAQAPPVVHSALLSPGQPLDQATRAFFELRFGYDFSPVRIHADEVAATTAQSVSALAYTGGIL